MFIDRPFLCLTIFIVHHKANITGFNRLDLSVMRGDRIAVGLLKEV